MDDVMSKKTITMDDVANGTGAKKANGEAIVPASEIPRVPVAKAYKMYVGGAFVRSESGRYFQVRGATASADPEVVNIPRGSRKDVRDAVLVAKNAAEGWAARTAFNRGQILYRLAEVMESRAMELEHALVRAGLGADAAAREVAASVDRTVYYAGFCDKIPALLASHNPVAGPHFGFSITEPMGVVGVVAPEMPYLLGLVSTVLPIVAGANVCVVAASETDPRTAIVWSECLATSDMPGGVINVLTGQAKELAPAMAKHREIVALEVWSKDADLRASIERDGADNVKRVKAHEPFAPDAWFDTRTAQGLSYIDRFVETKSVWHPVGI